MAGFLIIISCIAAFSPWPWAWRVWTFMAMLGFALLILLIDHESAKGPGAAIGAFLFVLGIAPAAFVMTIRLAWRTWKAARPPPSHDVGAQALPDHRLMEYADLVLLATGGALVGFFCVGILTAVLAGTGLGYLAHGLASMVSMAGLVLLIRPWLRRKFPQRWRSSAFMQSVAVIVGGASIAGAFYPRLVIDDALAKADGHPHCIAMNASDRPVLSRQDLTFFAFDRGNRHQHHAILLVERHGELEAYHWSYRHTAFQPGLWNWKVARPDIACAVAVDFAKRLPLFG